MKVNIDNIVLALLVIANIFVTAESLLDYKTDKLIDVDVSSQSLYIYKK
ncbi:MAG: hypothetical protein IJ809_04445 [Clostridia bacterium]|nr:hypothetical protein [Clostridia bacterium]